MYVSIIQVDDGIPGLKPTDPIFSGLDPRFIFLYLQITEEQG